jgi:hypothetical protein
MSFKSNIFPNIKFGDPHSSVLSYQFYFSTSCNCPSDPGEVTYLCGAFVMVLTIFLRARKDQNIDVRTQHNFKLYLILYCI